MKLSKMINRLLELQGKYREDLEVEVMTEGLNVQLHAKVTDIAICRESLIIIGNEDD